MKIICKLLNLKVFRKQITYVRSLFCIICALSAYPITMIAACVHAFSVVVYVNVFGSCWKLIYMVKFLGLLLRKIRLFYSFKINMSYGYIFKTKLFIKLTLKINIFESEKHNIIIIILIIVKKCDFLLYNHSL